MTDIYFSFDTEDFISDHAADAIRDEAELLHEFGVRANFNIVGYNARMLVQNRRIDVLDALRNHTISFHSLAHSVHPTICEYTDKASYEEARTEFMRQENVGIGMVTAATGADFLPCACPPGNSFSYVAMYGYADLGIPIYIGSLFNTPDGSGVHFCNQLHLNYDNAMEFMFLNENWNADEFLDSIAGMKRYVIYNHPNMVLYRQFWDMVNYNGSNIHPDMAWEEPERRTSKETARYYSCMRELVGKIKNDARFRIRSIEELMCEESRKEETRIVTKDMLPAIRNSLRDRLHAVSEPVSMSVSECFAAAAHFLFSDMPFRPGKSFGFLEMPVGTEESVTLTAEEVRKIAASIDFSGFIPASFCINGKKIGPADLLYAMLDVACGDERSVIIPIDSQQCEYDEYPSLRDLKLENTWIHSPEFKDEYLSNRLRLQAWTLRPEV